MEPTDTELSGPTPRARGPIALAAVLVFLVGGALVAIALRSDGEDADELTAKGGDPVGTTTSSSTTTSTTAPATTTTTAAAVTVAPTTAPTTTAPAVTSAPTTTAKAAPAFTLSPNSGPGGTQITASGSGCQGQDAGIGLTIKQPDGQPYTGDGAAAQPDGTWQVPFSIPNGGPGGKWTVEAQCRTGNSVAFSYAPQTFTKTG